MNCRDSDSATSQLKGQRSKVMKLPRAQHTHSWGVRLPMRKRLRLRDLESVINDKGVIG